MKYSHSGAKYFAGRPSLAMSGSVFGVYRCKVTKILTRILVNDDYKQTNSCHITSPALYIYYTNIGKDHLSSAPGVVRCGQ